MPTPSGAYEDVMRALDVDADPSAAANGAPHVATATFRQGAWEPPAADRVLAFVVIDGLLGRDVDLAGFPCTELLGAGDVLRPWDQHTTIPVNVHWHAFSGGRIAVLGQDFLHAMARRPIIAVALLRRSVIRSQSLATHLAITCLVGVDVRLHTLFWHLADRWGRVTRDGVELDLPLTHQALAHLVRSRRPSVSAALKELGERDLVVRRDDAVWILKGSPPQSLQDVAADHVRVHDRAPLAPSADSG